MNALRIVLALLIVLQCLALPSLAGSQLQDAASLIGKYDETIQDTDTFKGTKAEAPVEKKNRQQNAGGSDGQGLCVLASLVAALRQQGQYELAEWIWQQGRAAPGGYAPSKLDKLLRRAQAQFPTAKLQWAFNTGEDWVEFAKRWTSNGYSVGITYARADRYPFGIDHMVLCEHAGNKDGYWLFMDNNFVQRDARGPRSWVPDPESRARVEGRGGPWVAAVRTANRPTPVRPNVPNPTPNPVNPDDDHWITANQLGFLITTSSASISVFGAFARAVISLLERRRQ